MDFFIFLKYLVFLTVLFCIHPFISISLVTHLILFISVTITISFFHSHCIILVHFSPDKWQRWLIPSLFWHQVFFFLYLLSVPSFDLHRPAQGRMWPCTCQQPTLPSSSISGLASKWRSFCLIFMTSTSLMIALSVSMLCIWGWGGEGVCVCIKSPLILKLYRERKEKKRKKVMLQMPYNVTKISLYILTKTQPYS